MSKKEDHINVIVSYLLRDDELMALRHYTENRISFDSFKEAKAKAARLRQLAKENNGFLFKPN
jgi:hypothetical protein